jgi:hypothetical protein
MLTTMPIPVDMAAHFPGLVPLARRTTRLHPRLGTPGVGDSSIGGPLLWPADEPWPVCHAAHFDRDGGDHPPCPRVPVAQLFARDVPDLPFPDGADVLQLLWCPLEHGDDSCPEPIVVWRAAVDVAEVLHAVPEPLVEAEDCYIPNACHVSPESVLEYPNVDIPDQYVVWAEAKRLEAETGWNFDSDLTVAPGIKTGGFPGWTQNPEWPICTCGTTMDHLMTIASWEFDGLGPGRWLPLEERHLTAGLDSASWQERSAALRPVREPVGIMLGDAGGIYLFYCPVCPDRPIGYRFDCS